MTASEYKEAFRREMIRWSEEVRRTDPNVFLRAAIAEAEAHRFPVWILVDARRPCDLSFFQGFEGRVMRVRIEASEETRALRGWSWTAGVDDADSECGLDQVAQWDLVIRNEAETSEEELLHQLEPLIEAASRLCNCN